MSRPLFANSPPPPSLSPKGITSEGGLISIASTWRSVRIESSAATVQTIPIALSSSACGPEPPVSIQCQATDDPASRPVGSAAAARSAEPTSTHSSRGKLFEVAELATFVQRVEGPLSEMLMENLQSSAFDDWPLVNPLSSLSQDDEDMSATQDGLLMLGDTLVTAAQSTCSSPSSASASGLSLVAADRSKSGSSLILAYAHPHGTSTTDACASPWCTHTAHVSVILNSQQRTAHWQLNACPTTLAVHPDLSNLVAVGTWPGDVLVWDSNAADSSASSVAAVAAGMAQCGHADAVAQVVWVPSSANAASMGVPSAGAKGMGGLWSAGTDGSVIEWRYILAATATSAGGKDAVAARLEPVRRCTVGVPMTRTSNGGGGGGGLGMPLRSLAIHADPMVGATLVLLGSDAGHVVHLDGRRMRATMADSALATDANAATTTVTSPHFKYVSHAGAVNVIVVNPHVPSLFATVGQDGKIFIHRLFKDTPLLCIQPPTSTSPNAAPLLSAAWSPSRPGLLAITSSDSLYLASICGSDPGAVVAQLGLRCTGPLLFHPTLPLLYVGVVENGASGMRVVKLAASALKLGDMEVRMKEMAELNRLVGGDGGNDGGDE